MLKVQIVPVTPFAQNCSIIWDDESLEAVIVDAGGEADKLQQIVQQLGVKVIALWNTHAHIDHIGAVGELARIWQIPVIGPHRDDEFWVAMLADIAQKYGFAIPEPVQVTQWLNGGDVVKLGQHSFEVRFAPGHTPGHVMFYNDEYKILWAGDVLFKGSIGRTDFPKSNHQQLLDSIQRECLSLDDDVQFIAGHGEMSTIGYERKYNPFLK